MREAQLPVPPVAAPDPFGVTEQQAKVARFDEQADALQPEGWSEPSWAHITFCVRALIPEALERTFTEYGVPAETAAALVAAWEEGE